MREFIQVLSKVFEELLEGGVLNHYLRVYRLLEDVLTAPEDEAVKHAKKLASSLWEPVSLGPEEADRLYHVILDVVDSEYGFEDAVEAFEDVPEFRIPSATEIVFMLNPEESYVVTREAIEGLKRMGYEVPSYDEILSAKVGEARKILEKLIDAYDTFLDTVAPITDHITRCLYCRTSKIAAEAILRLVARGVLDPDVVKRASRQGRRLHAIESVINSGFVETF